MNIVIRVDSSSIIGSGHLMRCMSLAERKRKAGVQVTFVCRELQGNISRLITKCGFSLHLLPKCEEKDLTGYAKWLTVSQEQDAQETVDVIKKLGNKVDCLVVDSYAIDCTWERQIRPYVHEIMVIDDLANRQHDCDVLLDQNFYLNKETRYQGLVPEHCELLLGPKHALLREEFFLARKDMQLRDGNLRNILVFYGGVDATDETTKAVKALAKMNLAQVEVTVIVGAGNSCKDRVAGLCQQAGFSYRCQVNNMAKLMVEADLMLGAGGTTTWERCYLGLPAIVTAVAENQWKICEDCARAGFIYYLGHNDEVTVNDICQAVNCFANNPEFLLDMQDAGLCLMKSD